MKPANTCLILGAGASKPYGYPLGEQLAQEIISLGKKGRDYWAKKVDLPQVKDWANSVADRFNVCRLSNPRMTIDQFLEQEYRDYKSDKRKRDEYETGMMLISEVIRKLEQPQREVVDWYQLLSEHLERSVKAEFYWPLRIITFNYDRSLEFQVARYHAWKTGLLQQEARRWLLERMSILHVYGDVGPLPDGQPKRDDFAPEYGVWRGREFWKGRETIKIIRSDDADTEKYEQCKRWTAEAEYLILLGFGYDKMNCERLGLSVIPEEKCVFSTAYNEPLTRRSEIETALPHNHYLGLPADDSYPGDDCYRFLLRTQVLMWALNGWPAVELLARLNRKDMDGT